MEQMRLNYSYLDYAILKIFRYLKDKKQALADIKEAARFHINRMFTGPNTYALKSV